MGESGGAGSGLGGQLNEQLSGQPAAQPLPPEQAAPTVLAMDGWGNLSHANGASRNGYGTVNGNGYHGVAEASVQPVVQHAPEAAGAGNGVRRLMVAGIAAGVLAGAALKWLGGGRRISVEAAVSAMQHLPETARIAGLNQGPIELEPAQRLPVDAWRQRLAEFIAPAPPPPPEPRHRQLLKRLMG